MRLTLNPGETVDFTIELETIEGVADSDFLDRLADRVYEIEELSDALMGLNPDGSIRASFVIQAVTSLAAAEEGLERFMRAFVEARPLCPPEQWADQPAAAVPTIGVVPVGRPLVTA